MFKARKIVVYVLLIIMLAAVTAGCSSRQKAAEATAASAPRDQAVTDDGRNIMYGSSVTSVSDVEITGDRGNYNVSMEDRAVAPNPALKSNSANRLRELSLPDTTEKIRIWIFWRSEKSYETRTSNLKWMNFIQLTETCNQ